MRVVALLATYNEERFIGSCVEHLVDQGLDVYLIDNDSTDRTVEIAERRLGRGIVGIEQLPRTGVFSLRAQVDRKAQLAAELDADWFVHLDADEIRLPPRRGITLAGALAEADRAGYNAVNFLEFTFVPTRESPDHDHPRFQETMRWYYPYRTDSVRHLKAWKRQPEQVDLAWGGHGVAFPGLRMYPQSFPMRHYFFLSLSHAVEKFVRRTYDPAEVADGMHRARAALGPEDIRLPAQAELRRYVSDDRLDPSDSLDRHPVFGAASARAGT